MTKLSSPLYPWKPGMKGGRGEERGETGEGRGERGQGIVLDNERESESRFLQLWVKEDWQRDQCWSALVGAFSYIHCRIPTRDMNIKQHPSHYAYATSMFPFSRTFQENKSDKTNGLSHLKALQLSCRADSPLWPRNHTNSGMQCIR